MPATHGLSFWDIVKPAVRRPMMVSCRWRRTIRTFSPITCMLSVLFHSRLSLSFPNRFSAPVTCLTVNSPTPWDIYLSQPCLARPSHGDIFGGMYLWTFLLSSLRLQQPQTNMYKIKEASLRCISHGEGGMVSEETASCGLSCCPYATAICQGSG
jgi:hypothetical protein